MTPGTTSRDLVRPAKGMTACLTVLSLLLPLAALACINVGEGSLSGGLTKDPKQAAIDRLRASMAATPVLAFEKATANAKPNESSDRELRAVGAVVSGNASAGIAMLLALEELNPGGYSVAANLGTAYELTGDNRRALQWISEGIRRNPASHEGTEWLHVLILETKLKLAEDPGWLKSHRGIEIDEKRMAGADYRLKAGDRSLTMSDVRTALLHQLTERMIFVKPKDPVVADLLYTFALLVKAQSAQSASDLAKMSADYGFVDSPALLVGVGESARAASTGVR